MKLSTDRTTIVIVNEISYITSLLEEEKLYQISFEIEITQYDFHVQALLIELQCVNFSQILNVETTNTSFTKLFFNHHSFIYISLDESKALI